MTGHSAFHLAGGGADVLVDPFLTGNPGVSEVPVLDPGDTHTLR